MMKRSLIRVALAGALLGAVALCAWRTLPSEDAAPRHDSAPGPLDGLAQHNRARIEHLRAELASARTAARGDDAGRAGGRYSAALVGEVQREIAILASARTMFNRDELIRDEMERLASNPEHVALAIDVAADSQLAMRLFSDEQAQARVYALQLLRHLAEAGDRQSVETAVDRIGATLNAPDPWKKGIEYDYVDALAVYLRSVGLDRFLADPAQYYDRMHLTERTSVEVQKAMYDSGILKDASPTTIAQVRKDFWSYLGKEPPKA